ncbi:hypothetical protein K440DRAFT_642687 [Wilcoxina mikolae CBS 423.85]|nr:hypothetical protein K440DRAFT_642687 [Wilcoxina mikolae CBS 423.85]
MSSEFNDSQHTPPSQQSNFWANFTLETQSDEGGMSLRRNPSRSTASSSGQSSNSTQPSPTSSQRRRTGSISHRTNSWPVLLPSVREAPNDPKNPQSLMSYISRRGREPFDVSILSNDGEFAALVGKEEFATFRYADDDKFDLVEIYPLHERYKPIASASGTWFAIVAKEKFEIYVFVKENNSNTPMIISQECKDIVAIALKADNSWICVGTAQGDIRRWRIRPESELPYASHSLDDNNLQPLQLGKQACTISFSPDNLHIVVGLWDAGQSATVAIFGLENGQKLKEWTINNLGVKGNHGITGLSFTTGGRIIVSTWAQNGYLMEKEIHGTAERTLSPKGTKIQCLAISPSGSLAYIEKNDIVFLDGQRLRVKLKREAPKQPRPQTSLAFTSDGANLRVLDIHGHLSAISLNGGTG